jgi:RHS repeat-associated protein
MIGLAKSLRVAPGDTISMAVYAKYFTPTNDDADITGLLAAAMTAAFGVSSESTGESGEIYQTLSTMFGSGSIIDPADWEDPDAPKAFLNYILFDEEYIPYDMGFDQIDEDALETGTGVPHDVLQVIAVASKPGYIYVYLSNENNKIVDVYFDDLRIMHTKSAVIQSDDYYPFGLKTSNSYSRENSVPNRYLYNGKELQEELGLGVYDYGARMYQPDIGRFGTIDKFADRFARYSPYN